MVCMLLTHPFHFTVIQRYNKTVHAELLAARTTCLYDKEGSVLINLHIFQSCAGDTIHILPYCVICGGLFLLQAFRVILEGLTV